MPTPVAYLRRSRVDARRPGTLSHEQQLAAIRRLADQHGDAELEVLEDWGRSGREEKLKHRDGFARLEAMIANGEVSAVYAYDLSRLGRSLITAHRLAKSCSDRNIPIRCADGYSPDVSTSMGRMVLNILASIAEYYADNVKERATVTTMMRRQRGDRIGAAPYGFRVVGGQLEPNPAEDIERLRDAHRRAGSVQGAVRLLNAEGYPTRRGGIWRSSTLAQVLEVAGDITRRPARGRPSSRTFLLSGLLRCSCGATLTGRVESGRTSVAYACKRAPNDPNHGRPASVSEGALLPWVKERVARIDWHTDDVEMPAAAVDQADLLAKRRRILDNYEDGLVTRDERNAKLAEVDALIGRGVEPARLAEIPEVDWNWPTATINGILRAMIGRVDLGPDLRPVGATWRLPPEYVS